jgi:hypothetical protein
MPPAPSVDDDVAADGAASIEVSMGGLAHKTRDPRAWCWAILDLGVVALVHAEPAVSHRAHEAVTSCGRRKRSIGAGVILEASLERRSATVAARRSIFAPASDADCGPISNSNVSAKSMTLRPAHVQGILDLRARELSASSGRTSSAVTLSCSRVTAEERERRARRLADRRGARSAGPPRPCHARPSATAPWDFVQTRTHWSSRRMRP